MRAYDLRFPPRPPADLCDRLTELPVGARATIRAVTFIKTAHNRWANDFRSDLTSAQVALVLAEGEHEISD